MDKEKTWREILAPGVGNMVPDHVLAQRIADRINDLEKENQRLSVKAGETRPPPPPREAY